MPAQDENCGFVVPLYGQAALDAAVAAERERFTGARQAALEKDAQRYRKLRAGKYSIQVARSILNDTPHGIDETVDALSH
jgi:hypothetical protein